MVRRWLVLIVLTWGVLAIPSLCRAGVLEHLCRCGPADGCSHEESCFSDPCAVAKPNNDGAAKQAVPTLSALAAPAPGGASQSAILAAMNPISSPIAVSPALKPGARPLLI